MKKTHSSIYVINRYKYTRFVAELDPLADVVYKIPPFTNIDLYKNIDIHREIAMRVLWKQETSVAQIKELDRIWA